MRPFHDSRFKVYDKDSPAIQEVRARILKLQAGEVPTQQDLNSSPVFKLRREADEHQSPSIVGEHWIPYLERKDFLADCQPRDFSYKEGWLPLYTRAGITKHLLGLGSLLNKERSSPLIAVVLPKMEFQYKQEYVIHRLHKSECLCWVSISYDANQRSRLPSAPTVP